MDKKLLTTFGEELVQDVARANGIDPGEARALVLITLKKNRARLLAAMGATPAAADAVEIAPMTAAA